MSAGLLLSGAFTAWSSDSHRLGHGHHTYPGHHDRTDYRAGSHYSESYDSGYLLRNFHYGYQPHHNHPAFQLRTFHGRTHHFESYPRAHYRGGPRYHDGYHR